ncbi:hypothetical protein LY78DRAFT_99098 [Colletotrichum sublineola]|nr:hypothetical protein LY78DRAFT_99098 [Colletotrichum sublineola]
MFWHIRLLVRLLKLLASRSQAAMTIYQRSKTGRLCNWNAKYRRPSCAWPKLPGGSTALSANAFAPSERGGEFSHRSALGRHPRVPLNRGLVSLFLPPIIVIEPARPENPKLGFVSCSPCCGTEFGTMPQFQLHGSPSPLAFG